MVREAEAILSRRANRTICVKCRGAGGDWDAGNSDGEGNVISFLHWHEAGFSYSKW